MGTVHLDQPVIRTAQGHLLLCSARLMALRMRQILSLPLPPPISDQGISNQQDYATFPLCHGICSLSQDPFCSLVFHRGPRIIREAGPDLLMAFVGSIRCRLTVSQKWPGRAIYGHLIFQALASITVSGDSFPQIDLNQCDLPPHSR